ncbi:transglycosylase SLT domain-containing protein [Microvirga flavescens]|uniref:transglycosylase SLT domain-containing protein n=1 Tax=Microvirga flavescens TaxID=2249811 RepID=UPI000DDBE3F7|nr:transglycosylase SLT domain-containing protein [Microvirga flavescens]
MRAFLLIALSAASICSIGSQASASANSCEREMVRAAAKYGVPLGMLYSVGLTETGKRGSLQPYAMNIEGKPYFAANASEAMKQFEGASRNGAKLIDLGCMQINHHYHRDKFASLASMLNPRDNVDYAAQFLKQLRVREGSWTMAVARYHAGPNNNPAQKQYVCRVVANMVATGFGEWTPGARAFCQ